MIISQLHKHFFREHFYEYSVHLDFSADVLGVSFIEEKAHEIYDNLSAEMKPQVLEYKNGARDKT